MKADIDWVRELCLSFPNATEQVTWGADLTFRISGKIFAVTVLESAKVWLSFKCSPDNFADLTERAGIIPAPYMARAQWVALETREALQQEELGGLLRQSYELVLAKLPKKTQLALTQSGPAKRISAKRIRAKRIPGKGKPKKRKSRKASRGRK